MKHSNPTTSKTNSTKDRLYNLVEVTDTIDWFDKLVFFCIILNYIVSYLTTYLDTPEELLLYDPRILPILNYIEVGLTLFFTLELALRLIAFRSKHKDLSLFKSTVKNLKQPLVIFDILAVLPLYIEIIFGKQWYFLKVFRVFRLLKMTRFFKELNILKRAFLRKKDLLLSIGVIILIILLITSSLIYIIESPYQENLNDSGDAIWWTIVTLTTVGYGDIYPVTFVGRILASFVALIGIGIIAIPSGIIATGLVEELSEEKNAKLNINQNTDS